MLTLLFLVLLFIILFFVARNVFYRIIGALCLCCIIGIGVGSIFCFLDYVYDKPPVEKPAEVRIYEQRVHDLLERNNENSWQVQRYLINANRHDLAESVILPKQILEEVDVHYMSINPERIAAYLKEEKKAWFKLRQYEVNDEFKKLKQEHNQIITEFKKLMKTYPKNTR